MGEIFLVARIWFFREGVFVLLERIVRHLDGGVRDGEGQVEKIRMIPVLSYEFEVLFSHQVGRVGLAPVIFV
jgi:hypothetical protein